MEEGTFVCDHEYYDLTFGGKNIHYMVMYSETGFQEITRTEYRNPFYLVEDITCLLYTSPFEKMTHDFKNTTLISK